MKRARSFLLLFPGLTVVLCSLTVWTVYRERRQERLNRDLIAAVKRNDTKSVVSLLDQGADANCHDEPYKPLPWWIMLRDQLREGKPKSSNSLTPLLLAVSSRSENLPLIQALLDHQANVHRRTESYKLLLFPIWYGNEATVHLLLKYGADVNPQTGDGTFAPLVFAMERNNSTEVLSDMLKRGVDVNERDENTALWLAVWQHHVAAVRLLLSYHADWTLRGFGGSTPLAEAKSKWVHAKSKGDSAAYQQIIHLLQQAGAKE